MKGNTTADINLRLLVTVDSYEAAGRLMDDVERAMQEALERHNLTGRFDFTGFQTRPCKAMQMEQLAGDTTVEAPPLYAGVGSF